MKSKIRELATTNNLTDSYLILAEARKIKALLALELQAARDDRRAQHKEFQEFMVELKNTLTKIQAQFKIEAQLLNLVRPQPAGEKDWGKGNHSNRCRTLDALQKKTR